MPIDLHTHSRASDGTDSPAELMVAAVHAGLDVVAITDHDTTAGWDEAAAATPPGLTLVRGAELSCRYEGTSLHLLAYLFDRSDAALVAQLDRARDDRVPRAQEIVRRLQAAGYALTWEDVAARIEPGGTVGRPHLADTLVANGIVADRNEAFRELLHDSSPFQVEHFAFDPVEAVRLVRAAGGVTVFAHPFARTRGAVVPEAAFADMAQAGLMGVEVEHRDNSEEDRRRLRAIALDHDLLMTGSSDYHGSGKENRLGENTTTREVYERLVAAATARRR